MLRRAWLRLGTVCFWLCWPALRLYLRPTRRTRVIVRAGGQLLLVRTWLSDGRWGMPGGGLHRGEAAAVGAARELREETGLEVSPSNMVELSTELLYYRGLRFMCTYLLADINAIEVAQRQQGESVEVQWFHAAEVGGEGFHEDVRRSLKLLVERKLF